MLGLIFSLFVIVQTKINEPAPIMKWIQYPQYHENFNQDLIELSLNYSGNSKNEDVEFLANYAYSKGYDLDFVKTLNAENGNRDPTLQSRLYQGGVRERSFGICQINRKFHKRFIKSKEFKNAFYQIDYCRDLWIDGKKKGRMPFNAFVNRNIENEFILIK